MQACPSPDRRPPSDDPRSPPASPLVGRGLPGTGPVADLPNHRGAGTVPHLGPAPGASASAGQAENLLNSAIRLRFRRYCGIRVEVKHSLW